MKYIILRGISEIAVLMPEYASHKDIAGNHDVISAGFCTVETYINDFGDIRAKCYVSCGSESLNLNSREEDAKIIERMFIGGM